MADTQETILLKAETQGFDKAQKKLEDTADATNEASEAAEKYENSIADAAKEAELFGVSINGITSSVGNVTKALKGSVTSVRAFGKALTLAFSAGVLGIVTALVAAFAETQKGMDLLEDATTALSAAWRELQQTALELFEIAQKLFGGELTLGEAWEQGTEAVGDYIDRVDEAV